MNTVYDTRTKWCACAAPFLVSFLFFLKINTTSAQQDSLSLAAGNGKSHAHLYTFDQDDDLVKEINLVFDRHKFDVRRFPANAFDFKKNDPFPLYQHWSVLQVELDELLRKRLDGHTGLDMYFASVLTKPSECRVVFRERDATEKRVLKRVLPVTDSSFIDLRHFKDELFSATKFRKEYLSKNQNLDLGKAELALVELYNKGPLSGFGHNVIRDSADRYLYIQSPWLKSGDLKTEHAGYQVRLKQGLQRHEKEKDQWWLFAWFDIVLQPNSEPDPNKWRTYLFSSRDKPALAGELTILVSKTDDRYSSTSILPGPSIGRNIGVEGIGSKSSLFAICRKVIAECRLKLCVQ